MTRKSQKLAALSILKQAAGPISLSMLSIALRSVPQRTLRRWLNTWAEQGVVDKTGAARATRYCYRKAESDPTGSLLFLRGLDKDLKLSLLNQLRDNWTHNSTAIEGNTLTLGDTHFVLQEGLTVSGKSLKDHQEVIGHAKAIDLLYASLSQPLSESFVLDLHRAVQTEIVIDIYKPVGDWKVEINSVSVVTREGAQVLIEYALPEFVPGLMAQLIGFVNDIDIKTLNLSNAHKSYAKIHAGFVHIHPFWDGNGRMARLIANIPLLKAGLPPLVIPQTGRQSYIQALASYQVAVGQLDGSTGVWPESRRLKEFEDYCRSAYSTTQALVEKIFLLQVERND